VLRQQLHQRANGRCENLSCQVCTPLEVGEAHHVRHRSKLGADTLDNLVWWCRRCHNSHHRPKAIGAEA
jgi:5-methylcytosine-specific restriction endonuclease McrA